MMPATPFCFPSSIRLEPYSTLSKTFVSPFTSVIVTLRLPIARQTSLHAPTDLDRRGDLRASMPHDPGQCKEQNGCRNLTGMADAGRSGGKPTGKTASARPVICHTARHAYLAPTPLPACASCPAGAAAEERAVARTLIQNATIFNATGA